MARNRTIGVGNRLPWHVPEDFQFFKDVTKGKVMIMGRKTFESFEGQPLPGRPHIVITRQAHYAFSHPLVHVVPSLDVAIAKAKTLIPPAPQEIMVIGGAEIYAHSLPFLNRLYLSVIGKDFEGDAHFPSLVGSGLVLVHEEPRTGAIPFTIQTFERPAGHALGRA